MTTDCPTGLRIQLRRQLKCSFSCLRRLKNYTRGTVDQETPSLLAMCTIQHETANKVINNDTELLINKFAGKLERNTHFF